MEVGSKYYDIPTHKRFSLESRNLHSREISLEVCFENFIIIIYYTAFHYFKSKSVEDL